MKLPGRAGRGLGNRASYVGRMLFAPRAARYTNDLPSQSLRHSVDDFGAYIPLATAPGHSNGALKLTQPASKPGMNERPLPRDGEAPLNVRMWVTSVTKLRPPLLG